MALIRRRRGDFEQLLSLPEVRGPREVTVRKKEVEFPVAWPDELYRRRGNSLRKENSFSFVFLNLA